MSSRFCWILAAALAAAIALGVAITSALIGVKIRPATPAADVEYESENFSTSVRESALDASNVTQLIRDQGRSVIVKGKVHSTHLVASGKVLILNLGPDYRSCLKVKVFSSDFSKWAGGPDKLKSMYEGKRIGVEGEITIYEDLPEITVSVPSQIQLLD